MSSDRARAHSTVVSLAAEREIRRPQAIKSAHPSGTKSKHEIASIPNVIAVSLSPIVPEVRTSKTKPSRSRKSKLQNDEQISIEQIGAFIRGMSAPALKARFPNAWTEHQTVKRKTRGKSWYELHPGFEKFPDFLRAMGPSPHPKMTVDRINPENPVYGPDLCRWLDAKGQANNRSTNAFITWHGERHTIAEWADLSGINEEVLKKRHQRRWTEARIFADAPVRRYRTPPAPLVPPPLPTPPGTYTYNVGPIPLMPADGWPDGFPHARQFETGYTQANAHAKRNGISPISRAYFGAWVIGSKVQAALRQIHAAGLAGYVYFRNQIPPEAIAALDARACACPAVREYFTILPFQDCFLEAYLHEEERKHSRSPYPRPNFREGAKHMWRDLVKRKPCLAPNEVWKFFQGK
ncbi:hypothetical protein EV128_10863 [Rhizobium azibense]|nr:hypothetical protein EV128_10863 [Rhizobium azibense]